MFLIKRQLYINTVYPPLPIWALSDMISLFSQPSRPRRKGRIDMNTRQVPKITKLMSIKTGSDDHKRPKGGFLEGKQGT